MIGEIGATVLLTVQLFCGNVGIPVDTVEQPMSEVAELVGQSIAAQDTAYQKFSLPTADEVQKINQYVNGLIDYGVGPQIEGRPACEREILEDGTGHCGMYSYLLVKELSRHGFYGATVYGITSLLSGDSYANHAVVQVQTTDGAYVYDPTYGIYYSADIATLLSCDDVERYKEGVPSSEAYYQTTRFFAEVNTLDVYLDIRNSYDLDLLRWNNATVRSSIPVKNAATQIIQYDRTVPENTISCRFDQKQTFYRMDISFMEEITSPLTINCTIINANGTKIAMQGDLVQDAYGLSFQMEKAVTAYEVQLEIVGDDELPTVACFDIYQ